jgi:hypothetical protein
VVALAKYKCIGNYGRCDGGCVFDSMDEEHIFNVRSTACICSLWDCGYMDIDGKRVAVIPTMEW